MIIAIVVLIVFLVGAVIGFAIGSTRRAKPIQSTEQQVNEYYFKMIQEAKELEMTNPALSIQMFEAAEIFWRGRHPELGSGRNS